MKSQEALTVFQKHNSQGKLCDSWTAVNYRKKRKIDISWAVIFQKDIYPVLISMEDQFADFVRKGYSVPISSQEFQTGLAQRFFERDGMYFLPDQAAEYDRKKMTSGSLQQYSIFVDDEASAIQSWFRNSQQGWQTHLDYHLSRASKRPASTDNKKRWKTATSKPKT